VPPSREAAAAHLSQLGGAHRVASRGGADGTAPPEAREAPPTDLGLQGGGGGLRPTLPMYPEPIENLASQVGALPASGNASAEHVLPL